MAGLQAFHWPAHAGAHREDGSKKSWYRLRRDKAEAIKAGGFTWVWFPPASDSAAPQGYMPRKWNVVDTAYGTDEEFREAIKAIQPVKALADVKRRGICSESRGE